MRSKDYGDLKATYRPLDRTQMVRVALVEGLKPDYPVEERKVCLELLKQFSHAHNSRLDILFEILGEDGPEPRQEAYVGRLLKQVDYERGSWERFDYDLLREKGVVIPHDGDLSDLVKLVGRTRENKVIDTEAQILKPDVDYLKHITNTHKLRLDGKYVVEAFAERKGFELPEGYNGRMTTAVYALLQEHGFTFIEALHSAVDVLRSEKYANRDVAVLTIPQGRGMETRIFPLDLVTGTELYFEAMKHRPGVIEMRHGEVTAVDFKYHGTNVFRVPRRTPTRKKPYNYVETRYLPDLERPRDMTLEWRNTLILCDCDRALDLRNFEDRRGVKTAGYAYSQGPHARFVVLYVGEQRGAQGSLTYPTDGFIGFCNKLRYNVAHGGSGLAVGEQNRAVVEAFKLVDFGRAFTSERPAESQVLRPMHIEKAS